jgi:hypothetical protein
MWRAGSTIEIEMDGDKSVTAVFIEFEGGDGTEGDPFQVSNLHQLQRVGAYLDKHFIQVADIDASETEFWENDNMQLKGFVPIGGTSELYPIDGYSERFRGVYNGDGHKIVNLFVIDDHPLSEVGLFGYIENGTIKNVELQNIKVLGYHHSGGVAGINDGLIENVKVSGHVSGNDGKHMGGVDSYSLVDVYVISFSGGVTTGGLVGRNVDNAQILTSYSLSNVNGGGEYHDSFVGGLVGYNNSIIREVFAAGTVTGSVSYDNDSDAEAYNGGLIGGQGEDSIVERSYWDTEATEQNKGVGDGDGIFQELEGLDTDKMTGENAIGNMPEFDWDNIWRTTSNGYPVLYWQVE